LSSKEFLAQLVTLTYFRLYPVASGDQQTSWSRILLEKLIALQILKKYRNFYGILKPGLLL
jgi:hypothetical protein